VDFTLPTQSTQFDLLAIVTHEAGHFLGLDHSPEPDATMYYAYNPPSTDARTLSEDDTRALCAAYPDSREIPNGNTCDPRRGFVKECLYDAAAGQKGGCALQTGPISSRPGLFGAALALGAALIGRRKLAHGRKAAQARA
jgi:hypothetical protein